MKLYYYQHDGYLNFGDDLNVWLWQRLLPGMLDDDPTVTLVGIGTLLNDQLNAVTPGAEVRLIFSTGVGYFGAPKIDATYRVYCVRGPLSAEAAGLPAEAAVADGALLLRRLYRPEPRPKKYKMAFMPHIDAIADEGWARACEEAGIGFIDPRWPTETVLERLCEIEVLLAEAMHGAIVADTLRIPWVAVTTASHILPFKWTDWCRSVNLEYKPIRLTAQVNPRKETDILTPVRQVRYWALRRSVVGQLVGLAKNLRPTLSADRDIERRTEQLEERLELLKDDIRAGRLTA